MIAGSHGAYCEVEVSFTSPHFSTNVIVPLLWLKERPARVSGRNSSTQEKKLCACVCNRRLKPRRSSRQLIV